MTGRGVDEARAGVVGDVIAVEEGDGEAVSRVEFRQRMRANKPLHHVGGDVL